MNAAKMEGNIVVNIIVCPEEWFREHESEGYIPYSMDNPAAIGGDYVDGYFYPPQPFPSWTRNRGNWIPPVPMPTDREAGKFYNWDELSRSWVSK